MAKSTVCETPFLGPNRPPIWGLISGLRSRAPKTLLIHCVHILPTTPMIADRRSVSTMIRGLQEWPHLGPHLGVIWGSIWGFQKAEKGFKTGVLALNGFRNSVSLSDLTIQRMVYLGPIWGTIWGLGLGCQYEVTNLLRAHSGYDTHSL